MTSMPDNPEQPNEPQEEYDPYAVSYSDAKRANLILNVLVVVSAMAGSGFLLYVAHRVLPNFRGSTAVEDVHTSRAHATTTFLNGALDDITFIVRDLDEAEVYNRKLAERIRTDLGITDKGLLYRLVVRNDGDESRRVALSEIVVTDDDGNRWEGVWLRDIADAENATAVGRLRLGQQQRVFDLPGESERQLEFFVRGQPPALSKLRTGRIKFADGTGIDLRRQDIRRSNNS
jgi:hypothetical protein